MMGHIKDIVFELYDVYRDKRRLATMVAFLMIFMFVICESAYRKSKMPYGNVLDNLSSCFYFFTMLWFSGLIYSGYKVNLCSNDVSTLDKLRHMVRKKYEALMVQTLALSLVFMPVMIVCGYNINFVLLVIMSCVCVLNVTNLPMIVMRLCVVLDIPKNKLKGLKSLEKIIPVCVYMLFCYIGENFCYSFDVLWLMCVLIVFGVFLYLLVERYLLQWVSGWFV